MKNYKIEQSEIRSMNKAPVIGCHYLVRKLGYGKWLLNGFDGNQAIVSRMANSRQYKVHKKKLRYIISRKNIKVLSNRFNHKPSDNDIKLAKERLNKSKHLVKAFARAEQEGKPFYILVFNNGSTYCEKQYSKKYPYDITPHHLKYDYDLSYVFYVSNHKNYNCLSYDELEKVA